MTPMTDTTNPANPLRELHRDIMNLPCKPYDGTDAYTHYCRGHRDARHAAAELVSAALSRLAEIEAGGEAVGDALADGFDGSRLHAGPNHSTIELWYDTEAQAVDAHKAINRAIDQALWRAVPHPAASPSQGWMPIETAPKDGEIVGAEWQSPGQGYPLELMTQTAFYRDGAWRYPSGVAWTPTHWMPLPASPAKEPI